MTMQFAHTAAPVRKYKNSQPDLSEIHELLSVALEHAREVGFDWNLLEDKVCLRTAPSESREARLDGTQGWGSEKLVSLIHDEDKNNFRAHLREVLGTDCPQHASLQRGAIHKVELRLKDALHTWRWVAISCKVAERDRSGRVVRVAGALSDIRIRPQTASERGKRDETTAPSFDDGDKLKSAILTAALDCIISINHKGEIISFNHAAERTFGYRSEDVIGSNLADRIIPPEWRSRHQFGLEHYIATGESHMLNRRIELTAMRADGSTFPVELAIVPLRDQSSPVFTAFIRDITERKRNEALQLAQNRILNMVATGAELPDILAEIARLAETNSEQGICSIMPLNADDAAPSEGTAPNLPADYRMQLGALEAGPGIANAPVWSAKRDLALKQGLNACASWPIFGKQRKMLGTFALYFREPIAPTAKDLELFGICIHLAGIAIEGRASEQRIRYLAHYDGLTSLPNRFLFKEYLDLALRNARRHASKFAVFFVDFDNFKNINDTFGHEAGDQALREIAARLRSSLRKSDKIARMGGDEFYVLIEDLTDGSYAADVAQKLLNEASRPLHVNQQECRLSASIGIALYPEHGVDEDTLLKNADSAMYRAKESGKNGYRFYYADADTGIER